MSNKLTQKAAELFDTIEKWDAFLELAAMQKSILLHWLEEATHDLRNSYRVDPDGKWEMAPWDNGVDTKWYLKEMGPKSLLIGFGWRYGFYLYLEGEQKFNSDLISERLLDDEFSKLRALFQKGEILTDRLAKCHEIRNFQFGSPHDGNLSETDMAWYAGNQRKEFLEQALKKAEQFTHDKEMTELIRKLNAEARLES